MMQMKIHSVCMEVYPLRDYFLCPFGSANLTPKQRAFNKGMSSVWQCVEWVFCKVVQLFAFVDFKKNVKLFLQPMDRNCFLAHFFTNCHTCLCGSQTSAIGLNTRTLEEYLFPPSYLILSAKISNVSSSSSSAIE